MDKTPEIADFTWRKTTPDDDEELVRMWKEIFGKPMTLDDWKWK